MKANVTPFLKEWLMCLNQMAMAVLRLLPICFLKNGQNCKLESVDPSAAEVTAAYQKAIA